MVTLTMQKQDQTMLEWFLQEKQKNGSVENIIGLIGVLNARCLAAMGVKSPEGFEEEVLEFCRYAAEHLLTSNKIMKAMERNWGQLPLILRLGDELSYEAFLDVIEKDYASLEGQQKKACDNLADYICGIKKYRNLTFIYEDDSQDKVHYPPQVSKNEVGSCLADARAHVAHMIKVGGAMIFRYYAKENDTHTINGFIARDGIIATIPPKELEYSMRLQPDGSIDNAVYDEVYEEAQLFNNSIRVVK